MNEDSSRRLTNFENVAAFMRQAGQEVKLFPAWPSDKTLESRVNSLGETFEELIEAIEIHDMVEVAGSLTDLLIAIYSTGHAFGIDLDDCFVESMRSNWSKFDEWGRCIRDDRGLQVPSDLYFPPDLEAVIDYHPEDEGDEEDLQEMETDLEDE